MHDATLRGVAHIAVDDDRIDTLRGRDRHLEGRRIADQLGFKENEIRRIALAYQASVAQPEIARP